jgi:hypothetical protein
MATPSIRATRAERRPRGISWSDHFVVLVTTQATVQGRAGFGLRDDVPAFPADKGNLRRLKGEGSGPLGPDGGLDLPSTVRFQPAPTASALHNGPLYELSPASAWRTPARASRFCGLLGMNLLDAPWPATIAQVSFGVAAGMALSLYVFAIKGWLR